MSKSKNNQLGHLRKELGEATKGNPRKHPKAITSLSATYKHNISLQSNPNEVNTTLDCFAYTFKDKISPELMERIKRVTEKTQERSDVFKKLLDKGFHYCPVKIPA